MPSVSPLKVCELRVIGCVQGVGFRLATREKARSLGVLGWVRNLADGSVEVRARGPSQSVDQLIAAGFEKELVSRIARLIDLNEYKRRQAAPGLKVTSKAFGVGRRIPVAQRYRG